MHVLGVLSKEYKDINLMEAKGRGQRSELIVAYQISKVEDQNPLALKREKNMTELAKNRPISLGMNDCPFDLALSPETAKNWKTCTDSADEWEMNK